jgi:hypothetical protein
VRSSILGGETRSRGWWGGSVSTTRVYALCIGGGLGLILSVAFTPWGVIGLAVFPGLAMLITMETRNDTLLTRTVRNRSWKERTKLGLTAFLPYTDSEWERINAEALDAPRRERKEAMRTVRAMRDTPDGVVGMSWLRSSVRVPGIQLHQPPNDDSYLCVAFSTDGQVEGIDGEQVFDKAQESFGRFLAQSGSQQALATRVQTLSRVLNADPVHHFEWLRPLIDKHAPSIIGASYRQLFNRWDTASPVQRRIITVTWPLTDRFIDRAARRGEGRDGWVRLMDDEIKGTLAGLRIAGFKNVTALTARGTMATIRHMQIPDFDPQKVADITPYTGWLPSADDWSYTTYAAEIDGRLTVSLCRTARIDAAHMETSERGAFWADPLLTRMNRPVARTISFHQVITPQMEARAKADEDSTSDRADRLKKIKEGALEDATTTVTLSAAERRRADLSPGTGIHGSSWVGYITISAANREALVDATEAIEDAAGQAGINELVWLDTHQAAAAASTWPVGRGIRAEGRSADARVRDFIGGTGPKEAL